MHTLTLPNLDEQSMLFQKISNVNSNMVVLKITKLVEVQQIISCKKKIPAKIIRNQNQKLSIAQKF